MVEADASYGVAHYYSGVEMICPSCGERTYIGAWPLCQDSTGKHGHLRPHSRIGQPAIHPRERVMLYRNGHTGEIAYPGRTDEPMPAKMQAEGYEWFEPSYEWLQQHAKETGVVNQTLNYDGSGRTMDSAAMATPDPIPDLTGIEMVGPEASRAAEFASREHRTVGIPTV